MVLEAKATTMPMIVVIMKSSIPKGILHLTTTTVNKIAAMFLPSMPASKKIDTTIGTSLATKTTEAIALSRTTEVSHKPPCESIDVRTNHILRELADLIAVVAVTVGVTEARHDVTRHAAMTVERASVVERASPSCIQEGTHAHNDHVRQAHQKE